jgi:mRNA-degrading endonuclease RelE of RelBE toxin-antitoxin system
VIYRIELAPAARRALTHTLPEAVAAACANFLREVLALDPRRVGKPLRDELAGR